MTDRFDRRDVRLWLWSCALLTLAFFPKLVPGWASTDDLALYSSQDERGHHLQLLSQGRYGMALLQLVFVRLGADPIHSVTFFSWISIGLFALATVCLARAWDLRDDLALALAACALPFVHPAFADSWSFHIAPIYTSLALALAFGALALLRRGRGQLLLPPLLVAIALSIYQVSLNPLAAAALLGFVLDLARVRASPEGRAATVRVWAITCALLLAGVALYLISNQLVLRLLHVSPEARNGLVDLSQWRARVDAIAEVYPRILYTGRALSAPWLVWLQLALLGLTALLLLVQMRGASRPLSLLLLAAALLSVVGVVGAVRVFYPSARSLNALGILWGGLAAILASLGGARLRMVSLGLAAVLGFGWIAIDHRASSEQLRRNARDLAIANRLVARLETLPGWHGVQRIALVDAPLDDGDLRTVDGNLNNSALGTSWSPGALLQEVTGKRLLPADAADLDRARTRCHGARWPASESAFIDGEIAAVCF